VGLTGDRQEAAAMTAERTGGGGRARRHRLVAGFVVAYLAAGGVTLALGDRVTGGAWLALHLVLLGAITNAIVVWSEHFAAALLRTAPVGERAATARALVLNLGVLAVLGGVHAGRPVFTAAGAWLVGAVVLAHAVVLAARTGRALAARLAETVWFYVAASAALLAAMGLGVLLAGGAANSGDAYRAMRLAHVHLAVLGWVGLAVVGTLFTLWPTVLRTRMVPGLERAVRWSLPAMVAGLVVATAGLLWQARMGALAGLAGYTAGLTVALGPFVRTTLRRRPHTAASWMLGAGVAWLVFAVVADLAALAGTPRVVDLDQRVDWVVPAVVVGFGLQVLTGALTYLLPVVWGRGAYGNRKLTGMLETAWPLRVAAVNLGVALLVTGSPGGWAAHAGWWLAGLGLGAFVPLAAAVLAWRVVEDAGPADPAG
jgi:nitrite reductase (NO-forming)